MEFGAVYVRKIPIINTSIVIADQTDVQAINANQYSLEGRPKCVVLMTVALYAVAGT